PERSARTSLPLTSSTAPAATPLYTLSLHDALPISVASRASAATRSGVRRPAAAPGRGRRARFARSSSATSQSARPTARSAPSGRDRKSTRLNSSHVSTSYAVFCLKKKNSCMHARPGIAASSLFIPELATATRGRPFNLSTAHGAIALLPVAPHPCSSDALTLDHTE